jgi:hypothetical protein
VSRPVHDGLAGVSLNLVPGQILPRIPNFNPPTTIAPHSSHQPRPPANNLDTRKDYGIQSQQQPPKHSLTDERLPRAQPQHSELPYLNSHDSSQHNINIQHKSIEPHHRHTQSQPSRPKPNGASSDLGHIREPQSSENSHRRRRDYPRVQGDRLESLSDPGHAQQRGDHAFRVQGTQRSVSFDLPAHDRPQIDPKPDRRYSDMPGHLQNSADSRPHRPDRHPARVGGAGSATPNTSVDSHSAQSHPPSLQTSVGSASTRSRSDAPQPRHLPKRLVMPMPLQLQQHPSYRGGPVAPAHLDPYASRDIVNSQPRAKDIPMLPESRKLVRKRAGAPNYELSAPATMQPVVARLKERDMMPKRLLSKRRNDL